MATTPVQKLTEEEYLEQDRANEFRSEYIDGEMLAMSGGTGRHSLITVNCSTELNAKLDGRGCFVLSPDMRVKTISTRSYVYPDVSVVCGPPIFYPNSNDILLNPLLIVEVLSPSTEKYDRNKKFSRYREIETFKEYLLVETESIAVSHQSRQPDNSWLLHKSSGLDATLFIPTLQITLSVGGIYRNALSFPI